jgi:hypothetical protein
MWANPSVALLQYIHVFTAMVVSLGICTEFTELNLRPGKKKRRHSAWLLLKEEEEEMMGGEKTRTRCASICMNPSSAGDG